MNQAFGRHSPVQAAKGTLSVAVKLVAIFYVQHICMAHNKAGLAVFLPSDEESAAVKQSEAAPTSRHCS